MPADAGEKTEAPTQRRLQEAREKGQVAKSADLSAAVGLLAGLMLLNLFGPGMVQAFMDLMRHGLSLDSAATTGEFALGSTLPLMLRYAWVLLGPFFVVMLIVAVVVNILQIGFLFTGTPLVPSIEKISPLKGLARIFSVRTAMKLVMNLAKVGIIGAIAYFTIKAFLGGLVGMSNLGFLECFGFGARMMFVLGLRLSVALFVLAIIDYAFQKYRLHQDLRMTKEEVKEELKRMEGDPTMRQRRRAVARQLAAQRMSQAVPKADVVVTNPTELAIALKYDHDTMSAPKVVARGAGYMAQRIRTIAMENGVPIIERKPLAQALYKACDIGDYVPPELYRAVAEVLAYVFELAGKGYRTAAVV